MGTTTLDFETIGRWGDDAIDLLYQHFYAALVGYARQLTGEETVAEDCVQEIFFRTWQQRPPFATAGVLKAYLFNSVRNESINYLRRQRTRQDKAGEVESAYREMVTTADGDLLLHREEVYRQLFRAIDKLPARQREIFLLSMQGKKNAEIAEAMRISQNTVKSQKRDGLEKLREMMNPEAFVLVLFLFG